MNQKINRLEEGQIFRNNKTSRLVRVRDLFLETARISIDPADREIAPYEMDISEFLKSFHLV